TTKVDADGHCTGDQCSDITVSFKQKDPPAFKENETLIKGVYETGVRGRLSVKLSKNGKALKGVPVSEKIVNKVFKNGQEQKQGTTRQAETPTKTDSAGKVNDDVGLQLATAKPASEALVQAVKTDQTTNGFVMEQTQTITFPGPNG